MSRTETAIRWCYARLYALCEVLSKLDVPWPALRGRR